MAAAETTQNTTQTMVSHFIKNNQSLEKIRKEFEAMKEEKIAEDPSLGEKTKDEIIDTLLTLDNVQDLEYLNWTIQEALRVLPPIQASSQYET